MRPKTSRRTGGTSRRRFLRTAASAAGVLSLPAFLPRAVSANPQEKVVVGHVGLGGRGSSLLGQTRGHPGFTVAALCDVDSTRLGKAQRAVGTRATGCSDYRKLLDRNDVDAIVVGTPDHWHALPTIFACQAGKDVYVEKPDGHNILEGRTMVAAMKKYDRIVQLGTQARSGEMQRSAMGYIAEGHLGKVRFAKAWESSRQGSIGYPKDGEPPAGVDYDFWLGPAPKRAFNPRRFHGSWRWFFDYGTGDMGNDGVHRLDVARWALETAIAAQSEQPIGLPRAISAHGGKYYFDDAQEWPDTLMVTYDYPGYVLTYEMRIWNGYPLHGESEGAAVQGDNGYVVIGNRRWRAFDGKGNEVKAETGGDNTVGHAQNFIDCMRSREKPNADLETVGHPSSLLCHLGNAAWRVGHTIQFDPDTYSFPQDALANQYLTRPVYREPWLLPQIAEL